MELHLLIGRYEVDQPAVYIHPSVTALQYDRRIVRCSQLDEELCAALMLLHDRCQFRDKGFVHG